MKSGAGFRDSQTMQLSPQQAALGLRPCGILTGLKRTLPMLILPLTASRAAEAGSAQGCPGLLSNTPPNTRHLTVESARDHATSQTCHQEAGMALCFQLVRDSFLEFCLEGGDEGGQCKGTGFCTFPTIPLPSWVFCFVLVLRQGLTV